MLLKAEVTPRWPRPPVRNRDEVFTVLFLGNRHRVIECLDMFRGMIDGASVLVLRSLASLPAQPSCP